MSKILELYAEILSSEQRFVDEVFEKDEYQAACPQLTIIDAGAYEGEFSFYCLNFAKKIYAFEPDPRPGKVLRDRITKFNLEDKIDLSDKALSIKSGERIFHNSGFGGSRLVEGDPAEVPEERIKVDTVSLADFFQEKGIEQVDILKIDVEHGEDEIFMAKEFPKLSKKIKLIIGEHLEAVEELLISCGYKKRSPGGVNFIYEH